MLWLMQTNMRTDAAWVTTFFAFGNRNDSKDMQRLKMAGGKPMPCGNPRTWGVVERQGSWKHPWKRSDPTLEMSRTGRPTKHNNRPQYFIKYLVARMCWSPETSCVCADLAGHCGGSHFGFSFGSFGSFAGADLMKGSWAKPASFFGQVVPALEGQRHDEVVEEALESPEAWLLQMDVSDN